MSCKCFFGHDHEGAVLRHTSHPERRTKTQLIKDPKVMAAAPQHFWWCCMNSEITEIYSDNVWQYECSHLTEIKGLFGFKPGGDPQSVLWFNCCYAVNHWNASNMHIHTVHLSLHEGSLKSQIAVAQKVCSCSFAKLWLRIKGKHLTWLCTYGKCWDVRCWCFVLISSWGIVTHGKCIDWWLKVKVML